MIPTRPLPILLSFALLLACEGTPHGPIEGAGKGLQQKASKGTLENTLKGLEHMPDPVAEQEENNVPSSAMLIEPGQRVEAGFGNSKDVDWFRMEIGEASVLRAEIARVQQSDVRLSLYDGSGKRLLRSVNNEGLNGTEIISNFQVKGTQLLKVEQIRPGKKNPTKEAEEDRSLPSYTLVMVTNPKSLEDEEEPNGAQRKAATLPIGAVVRGYLNVPEDVDFFKAPPAPAGTRAWNLHFLSSPDCTTEVAVFHGKPGRATTTSVPPGRRAEIFGIRADDKDTLFVRVSGLGSVNVNTPYRLSLVPQEEEEEKTRWNSEPNDSTQDCMEMTDGSRDWIGWSGDRDYWRVSNARKGILKVEISGVPGVPLKASVIDDTGTPMGTVAGEPGEGLLLPNVSAGSTPRFVVVEATNGAANSVTPYTIQTTFRKGGSEEREPNNALAQALRYSGISLASPTEGYLSWAQDTDWHHLDLRNETMAAIMTVKIQAPPSVTIQVRWTNADGAPITAEEVIPANTVKTLTTFAPPASYGLEIRGVAGGHSTIEPYSITIIR